MIAHKGDNRPGRQTYNRPAFRATLILLTGMVLCWGTPRLAAAADQTNLPTTLPELRAKIAEITGQPRYKAAMWGIKIVQLATRKVVYEQNAEKLFSPASNSKLYTMALALDRLGPDYQIRTSLYAAEKPDGNGTLTGDLVIYGRGDPAINARRAGGDIFRALEPLVAALTNAGVKRIQGDVVGDESYFHGPPLGGGWEWEDLQSYYGAELSALTINDNALQVVVKPGLEAGAPCWVSLVPATTYLSISNRTHTLAKGARRSIALYRPLGENVLYVSGSMAVDDASAFTDDVAIHQPAGLFASWFKEALLRQGIEVTGRARSVNWLDREIQPVDWTRWQELGALTSLPVRELLAEVLKPSQNLYTDLLLAQVGMAQLKGRAPGSEETAEQDGVRALRTFLTEAGIPRSETALNEGSGLSRNNLCTPKATVHLLEFMNAHKYSAVYSNALPIAGVDGTLRRRMKGTAAEGKVHAKTGTLSAANSLSGYVTTAAGEPLAFSLMLNRYQGGEAGTAKTADLDTIAALLAGFTGRTDQ